MFPLKLNLLCGFCCLAFSTTHAAAAEGAVQTEETSSTASPSGKPPSKLTGTSPNRVLRNPSAPGVYYAKVPARLIDFQAISGPAHKLDAPYSETNYDYADNKESQSDHDDDQASHSATAKPTDSSAESSAFQSYRVDPVHSLSREAFCPDTGKPGLGDAEPPQAVDSPDGGRKSRSIFGLWRWLAIHRRKVSGDNPTESDDHEVDSHVSFTQPISPVIPQINRTGALTDKTGKVAAENARIEKKAADYFQDPNRIRHMARNVADENNCEIEIMVVTVPKSRRNSTIFAGPSRARSSSRGGNGSMPIETANAIEAALEAANVSIPENLADEFDEAEAQMNDDPENVHEGADGDDDPLDNFPGNLPDHPLHNDFEDNREDYSKHIEKEFNPFLPLHAVRDSETSEGNRGNRNNRNNPQSQTQSQSECEDLSYPHNYIFSPSETYVGINVSYLNWMKFENKTPRKFMLLGNGENPELGPRIQAKNGRLVLDLPRRVDGDYVWFGERPPVDDGQDGDVDVDFPDLPFVSESTQIVLDRVTAQLGVEFGDGTVTAAANVGEDGSNGNFLYPAERRRRRDLMYELTISNLPQRRREEIMSELRRDDFSDSDSDSDAEPGSTSESESGSSNHNAKKQSSPKKNRKTSVCASDEATLQQDAVALPGEPLLGYEGDIGTQSFKFDKISIEKCGLSLQGVRERAEGIKAERAQLNLNSDSQSSAYMDTAAVTDTAAPIADGDHQSEAEVSSKHRLTPAPIDTTAPTVDHHTEPELTSKSRLTRIENFQQEMMRELAALKRQTLVARKTSNSEHEQPQPQGVKLGRSQSETRLTRAQACEKQTMEELARLKREVSGGYDFVSGYGSSCSGGRFVDRMNQSAYKIATQTQSTLSPSRSTARFGLTLEKEEGTSSSNSSPSNAPRQSPSNSGWAARTSAFYNAGVSLTQDVNAGPLKVNRYNGNAQHRSVSQPVSAINSKPKPAQLSFELQRQQHELRQYSSKTRKTFMSSFLQIKKTVTSGSNSEVTERAQSTQELSLPSTQELVPTNRSSDSSASKKTSTARFPPKCLRTKRERNWYHWYVKHYPDYYRKQITDKIDVEEVNAIWVDLTVLATRNGELGEEPLLKKAKRVRSTLDELDNAANRQIEVMNREGGELENPAGRFGNNFGNNGAGNNLPQLQPIVSDDGLTPKRSLRVGREEGDEAVSVVRRGGSVGGCYRLGTKTVVVEEDNSSSDSESDLDTITDSEKSRSNAHESRDSAPKHELTTVKDFNSTTSSFGKEGERKQDMQFHFESTLELALEALNEKSEGRIDEVLEGKIALSNLMQNDLDPRFGTEVHGRTIDSGKREYELQNGRHFQKDDFGRSTKTSGDAETESKLSSDAFSGFHQVMRLEGKLKRRYVWYRLEPKFWLKELGSAAMTCKTSLVEMENVEKAVEDDNGPGSKQQVLGAAYRLATNRFS